MLLARTGISRVDMPVRVVFLHRSLIHSPRVGRDRSARCRIGIRIDFNPLAPCGARRRTRSPWSRSSEISIHSPRVGRDNSPVALCRVIEDFNPLAPCGARPGRHRKRDSAKAISIHSPRVGRDSAAYGVTSPSIHFNPLAPCGARLMQTRFTWVKL